MNINEITGASLVTKASSEAYRQGWDSIFNKMETVEVHPRKQILLRNSGVCTICMEEIVSRNRHDFVRCKCGASFVDGGLDYQRCGGSIADTAIYTDEDDIELIRQYFTWKSYGPNGDQPARYITLCFMTTDHIEAIMRTQVHILGTYVEDVFKMELEYRKDNNL